ncbi:adenylosuccinate synthase [bacterium]|nr:adenylosuccinate synthase [bacterium]
MSKYDKQLSLEDKPAAKTPNVSILVGAQWGDEGKGKWIDMLAKDEDMVARYQGGNNAGHTLYIEGQKVVLHQLPSGIFHDEQVSVLTAGVVINPVQLVDEMSEMSDLASLNPERVWVSGRAHVITPWHVHLDTVAESKAETPIGTTKRGIGPTYAEKASRTSMRMAEYVNAERRATWIEALKKENEAFALHLGQSSDEWAQFEKAADTLAPFVCDAEERLRRALSDDKSLLLEGAQGTLLDINHGTYPFVTSSNTIAGGAVANLGISAKLVKKSIGIAKVYITRVGEGPFPTELFDLTGEQLARKGHEFGATTGRPRRCGWLDAVSLRYACEVNGFDELFINKMDIISGFPEIKICTAYDHPSLGRITYFPSDASALTECVPVYETLPGWEDNIPTTGAISDLPENAINYIRRIEELCKVSVTMVGTGPGRTDFLKK